MFSSGAAASGRAVHGTLHSRLRVEWRRLPELTAVLPQWSELAGRAIEPNVFYEPSFAMAAAPVLGAGVGAGLVWSHEVPARLLGFFPARIERRRYGFALPVLTGWIHAYAPLGSPLIDCTARDAVIDAWLGHMARDPSLPKLALFPYLPCAGALSEGFDVAIERSGGRTAWFGRHARAFLAPPPPRESWLAHALDGKKRKELRRQRKRLGEEGILTSEAAAAEGVPRALDEFLLLEAKGWKGRARTAARCHPEIAAFMRAAVGALAREGKASVAQLCVNAHAIAAIITLRSGHRAWCWKIAYDESYARFSPGVQILLDATETLLLDPGITGADSCATPDHPMIDHVWRERLVLADRLLSVSAAEPWRFALACKLERARRGGIRMAKTMRDRMHVRRAD
jgi:hypothetical protein